MTAGTTVLRTTQQVDPLICTSDRGGDVHHLPGDWEGVAVKTQGTIISLPILFKPN